MNIVRVKLLDKPFFDEFGLPRYATAESAGMDLRACIKEPIHVPAGDRVLIPTGLVVDLNDRYSMWVLVPKSGLGHKKGFVLGNLVGIIDSDYHLEVGVSGWNTSSVDLIFHRGDFICQALLVPILRFEWEVVDDLNRNVNRNGGWGSTGDR